MTELEWLELVENFLDETQEVVKTKNEDTAIIKFKDEYLLLTTDAIVENVHFSFDYFGFYEIGWKLGASNLSDIAACGGEPLWALLSLGFPKPPSKKEIKEFFKGLKDILSLAGAKLVGGDTVYSPISFFSLSIIGKTKNPITRRGASPGDFIFVSKKLGQSAAFLRLIKEYSKEKIPESIRKAHLLPEPEVCLGKALSKRSIPSAMMDISDGLIMDLYRLCKDSKIGAILYKDRIPVGEGATLEEALSGGEDFALLFTVPENKIDQLKKLQKELKKELFIVGEITQKKGIFIKNGEEKLFTHFKGYDHFK